VDVTPAELTFEAGTKATKSVRIRNAGLQPIGITTSGPHHKNFAVSASTTARKISPGTALTLAVTFRPGMAAACGDDEVIVATRRGSVIVPVRVVAPKASLKCPERVSHGLVSVGSAVSKEFRLSNPSRFEVCWTMDTPAPFYVSPAAGAISPRTATSVAVTFRPSAAKYYGASATLKFDAGEGGRGTIEMAFDGSAQYPFLRCELPEGNEIRFDNTAVQSKSIQELKMKNVSPVPAVYTMSRAPGPAALVGLDISQQRFQVLSGASGVVQPGAVAVSKISYTPSFPGENVTEYFTVDVTGGVSQRVACNGSGISLQVALKPDVLKFVDVPCGSVATKSVFLRNDSDIPTTFQVIADCSATFHCVEPASGALPAQTAIPLTIKFTPTAPWRYQRHLTILLLNHPSLRLQLLANSHDVTHKFPHLASRPRPVLPIHLENTIHFEAVNIAMHEPDDLRRMLHEEGTLKIVDGNIVPRAAPESDLAQFEYCVTSSPEVTDVTTEGTQGTPSSLESGGAESNKVDEPAPEDADTVGFPRRSPLVFISPQSIDFGSCPAGSVKRVRTIGSRKIDIKNTSKSDVEVLWTVPDGPLTLDRTHALLTAGEVASFALAFMPTQGDTFFEETIECYFDKTQALQNSDIDDAFIMRPFRVPIHVTAETFNGAPIPPSKLHWGSDRIVCNPVAAGETAHATIQVQNRGESSAKITYLGNSRGERNMDVQCTPNVCVLRPGSSQVLSIDVTKGTAGTGEFVLPYNINNEEKYEVTLVHSVFEPSITFGSNGTVSFLPTGRGATSETSLTMRSTSQVPISYEWHIPHELKESVNVNLSSGVILPNQMFTSKWTYTPTTAETLCASIPIVFNTNGDSTQKTSVVVSGRCHAGVLVAVPERIDFGNVIRGESAMSSVTLFNPSGVDVSYVLDVDTPGTTLDLPVSGLLKPLERRAFSITVRPDKCGESVGAVKCKIIDCGDSDAVSRLVSLQYCAISPELTIRNAFCASLSKSEVWRRFSITRLNDLISGADDASVCADEEEVIFNFGAGPQGSETREVFLELHNSGSCATEWALQFPNNLRYVPDERWAESDVIDPAAHQEKDILKSRIFDASPRVGTLRPGCKTTVMLSYKFSRVAVDGLSVILKVTGRPGLPLRLLGSTLERGCGFLDVEWHHVELAPQPIGLQLPPVQYITAMNRGDKTVMVMIDKSGFSELATKNYGFPIMQCGGNSVEVQPGASLVLPVRFQPMEAKTYVARLGIQTQGQADVEAMSIVGRGYDPRDGHIPNTTPVGVPAVSYSGSATNRSAILMCEALDFGIVSVNSIAHRMLVVRNTSTDGHSLVFDFSAGEFSSVIRFSPKSGRIDAGETAAIRVTFCPDGVPQMFNFDAVCSVTDEEYVLMHEQSMAAYEESVVASETTFNFTDSGRTGRGRAGVYLDTAELSPSTQFAHMGSQQAPTDSSLRTGRYQALPPIKRREVTKLEKPEPRKSAEQLFCAIIATTVSSTRTDRSYVNRYGVDETNADLQSASVAEDTVVSELLENMLCHLLTEDDFKDALMSKYDRSKPGIYFRQLIDTHDSSVPEEETHGDVAVLSNLEDLLENTLANIVAEALEGSFDVTARTRRIVSSAT